MSENLRSFVTGAGMLRSVANRVPADAWDQPSCCEGWTAREVAGHISWGLQATANFANGGAMPDDQSEAERAGDDPAATITAAVDDAIAAVDQPGALERETPFGMGVDGFLALMGVDTLTHAWDIADATGIEPGIDQAAAVSAKQTLSPFIDQMRGPGRFGDEVATESHDAIEQLIAFTGRTSVRA